MKDQVDRVVNPPFSAIDFPKRNHAMANRALALAMENPGALAGATGANKKAGELLPLHTMEPTGQATADRLRHRLITRRFGLTDHTAAQIAALVFAGGAA